MQCTLSDTEIALIEAIKGYEPVTDLHRVYVDHYLGSDCTSAQRDEALFVILASLVDKIRPITTEQMTNKVIEYSRYDSSPMYQMHMYWLRFTEYKYFKEFGWKSQ